ncbi:MULTISPECIES: His-Xaa-Ser system radical SAM maturase HxsB [Proteus]|uniref:His-Xaa-Ser system radical SAM maturase HxsB n=1 Tax=Proteus TaxID=583 RepID=UPI000D68F9EF|nr:MULTISPECIES: His-Xaa-Ser system radical SAM maturase HxsB [Proteus]
MNLLPFNLEHIDNNRLFISNLAGFNHVLSYVELSNIIDFGKSDDEKINKILRNKLFITDEDTKLPKMMLASGLGKKLMSEMKFSPIFMIVPTLRCDHTCKYCQVSRASISANNFDLNENEIPKIISIIKNLSKKNYKIEIQGGEPLIRFDLVKKIYDEAVIQLGQENIEFVITSSLSLLTDEMIEWSEEKPVIYSVSLDGDEYVHNKNRILPTKNSFQIITENIKKLQCRLGKDRVSTVTTVTKELLHNPQSLIDAHFELDIFDLFIRPISPYGFAEKKESYTISEYISFYEKLLDIIFEENKKGFPFVEHSGAIHIKRLYNPGFCGYADLKSPSGIIFNSLLFNYDGKVYGSDESRMLQQVYSDIDFSLGDFDSLSFNKNPIYNNLLSNSFNMLHVGCETCAFQPYCGVDPCQNISLFGEPIGNKSLSRFCLYHKGMFKLLVKKIDKGNDGSTLLKSWAYA